MLNSNINPYLLCGDVVQLKGPASPRSGHVFFSFYASWCWPLSLLSQKKQTTNQTNLLNKTNKQTNYFEVHNHHVQVNWGPFAHKI